MTFADRVRAVARLGFTDRQAGFLVTVMLHSGVCLGRQYCTYSRIARGQKMQDFFARLVARRFATAYNCAHRKTRIFHVHAKALYRAIDEPDNRHRRPVALARAVERLMVLDAVLADRETQWLATEREKVAHFEATTTLRANELPYVAFGRAPAQTLRYFPDKLPVGIESDGRTHRFLYLAVSDVPAAFRAFLHRHAELLRALRAWRLHLLVPRHMAEAIPLYTAAAREELATPLRSDLVDELRWYFDQRRRLEAGDEISNGTRFERDRQTFGAPRFRVLYRVWCGTGDAALFGTTSRVLADALAERTGHVECHVLPRPYQHLAPLVGSA